MLKTAPRLPTLELMSEGGTPIRVLFVDDDWDELEQMRRATRARREEWDIEFACGASEALRLLSTGRRPDVVVSELTLRDQDGVEILQRVQEVAPGSVRILHSDSRATMAICRSIPWTHQFLPKPCDVDRLAEIIDRVLADPDDHESHAVKELAASVDRLPAIPATYARIAELTADDDFSMKDVGEAIRSDVALTAETLKVVNSSFFGLRQDVSSVEQAVALLGLDVVKGLVLANSLFDADASVAGWLDLDALSARSRDVASLARGLARTDGLSPSDQAQSFLAGMVQDIGLLVAGRNTSIEVPPGVQLVHSPNTEVDRELFGVDRYAVGAYLLRMWAFDHRIVEAVAGLGVPPGVVDSPLAEVLRLANHVLIEGGFSVEAWLRGDDEAVGRVEALVFAERAQPADRVA